VPNITVGSACSKNCVILNTRQEVTVVASGGDEGELQPRTSKLELAGKEVESNGRNTKPGIRVSMCLNK